MSAQTNRLPNEQEFQRGLRSRQARGTLWSRLFFAANFFGLFMLIILVLHILNQSFGLVIIRNNVEPATLSETPLEDLNREQLARILVSNLGNASRAILRDSLSIVPVEQFTTVPLDEALGDAVLPPGARSQTIGQVDNEILISILAANFSQDDLYAFVVDRIVQPRVERSWRLLDSIFSRSEIEAVAATEEFANDRLEFRAWLNLDFITSSASSSATTTGLRTALLGSFWIIGITILVAFPLGVAAAIYLEEYATDNWVNRLIEINLRNLAAVPSIIYGMLGLAVFVRILVYLTSGRFTGLNDTNGRTVLSAAFTLALLILPVIIVNAREAIRAVPPSIREASFGLGATRWQTVSRQVLPAAVPGILTGVILAMSRAVGETAPLIVVGASTFLGTDPNGPFSKFTVVPIQIFQWTSEAQPEFKLAAAAAIIVLLVLMLTLNATAIIIRNRFSRRLF
ncbi:MAG: phosphate ABC transporter permease PstA [bacterium]|nr:phosphate ABC transporter permease PstA [bacterium]